ncbi:MAG: PepSY domain-containing protein [Pseudomonadota bacterium]
MGLLSLRSSAGNDQSGAKPRKKKSARKRLYELHTWVGFHLAIIMVVVLFTGTMATVSNELDWLTQHDMRVSPGTEKVSYDEMLEAVRAYDPSATILGVEHMMGDHFAYRVPVFDENATQKFIHVNQWTGEVTGQTPYFTLQRFFRDLHRYLYMPKIVGLTLVCSMAIILSISLYTGLKTSRNWRTLMTRIRFSKGPRTAIGDAHKAAGLWSIWFFVLMISTGLWYYAEFLGKDFEPPVPDELRNISAFSSDVIVDPPAEEILRVAKAAYPELNVTAFNFSMGEGSAIRVMGKVGNPIVRQRANAVYLHPETLEVLYIKRSRDLPAVQWTNQIADPLHFGDFGGLPLKLVYFVFGLFMTGLSVSGVWLTWRRLKSRGASSMQIAAMPLLVISGLFASITYSLSNLPVFAGLNPMPYVWFVVGIFLAGGTLLCAWWLSRRVRRGAVFTFKNAAISVLTLAMGAGAAHATLIQNPHRPQDELVLARLGDGPVQADAFLQRGRDGQPTGQVRFVIVQGASAEDPMEAGRLNLKTMAVHLLDESGVLGSEEDPAQRRFRVAAVLQPAFLRLSAAELEAATHMRATFEMQTGATYELTWEIPRQQGLDLVAASEGE